MRVVVAGCGAMGAAAAYDLARDGTAGTVVLADARRDRVDAVARALRDAGATAAIETAVVDAVAGIDAALGRADAVAVALPWPAARAATVAALRGGVPVAGITRPLREDPRAVVADAGATRAAALFPCGLEPGLTEIAARRCAQRLDDVAEVHVRCGGVPSSPSPPLGYKILFGGTQLPIALRDALAVVDGKTVAVPRFSGVEHVDVPGVGRLEAYHDGMTPWLASDPVVARAATVTQKTLRWPGFARRITVLGELGLLSERPVDVDGARIAPKRFVEAVLAPAVAWTDDDEDVVVLRVEARGVRAGRTTVVRMGLVDRLDARTRLTAMARTTGFTLASCTRLLASRAVDARGWVAPQEAFAGAAFDALARDLGRHGIVLDVDETATASERGG